MSVFDASGGLTIAGASGAVSGNVTFSSSGVLAVNANVGSALMTGTITLSADTAGSGTAGSADYTQAPAANLITTNTSAGAVTIDVNTSLSGTANAIVGNATVGGTTGGTYNVDAYGGSISWNETTVQARGVANNPANLISAYGFNFTDTGAGGLGTSAIPMQIAGPIENHLFAQRRHGGIFLTDFGEDLQINQALATGGDIDIETSNAGTHDLLVNGMVSTAGGNIRLYADDDLILNGVGSTLGTPTTGIAVNALIGSDSFSGTVDLQANLDLGGGQGVFMWPGSAIDTNNTTASAVSIQAFSSNSATGASLILPLGGAILSNITTGPGGGVTVVAGAGAAGHSGSIAQLSGTSLSVGATGTVTLSAFAATTVNNDGNIGTSANPIVVSGGTISATTVGIAAGTATFPTGNIFISTTAAASVTASTTGSSSAVINLVGSGGVLTIGGATSTIGGAITLSDASGVMVSALLGSTSSGAIAITGPLSGSGNIQLGTGGLTLNQSTGSTFAGVIQGPSTDSVVKSGGGSLVLSNANTYNGATAINAGSLVVNNSLSNTSGVTTSGNGLLAGSGTVNSTVADSGIVAPGGGAGGTAALTTGSLSFGSGGVFEVDLSGTGYDQLQCHRHREPGQWRAQDQRRAGAGGGQSVHHPHVHRRPDRPVHRWHRHSGVQ